MEDFQIPQVVRTWVEEVRNTRVPVWTRDNYAARLEKLAELIQSELAKFEKERDQKTKK